MTRAVAISGRALIALTAVATLVAVGWWLGPGRSGSGDDPELAALDVPLFSARRLPQSLLHGAGSLRLTEQLDEIVAAAPAQSCLALQPRGTGPVITLGTDEGLVPASLVKLLVTQTALDRFGPDHRFTTRVAATEAPVDGVVDDLFLIGGGDPYLATDGWVRRTAHPEGLRSHTSLETLADRVVAAGITRIRGSVVGDSGHFLTIVDESGPFRSPGPVPALTVNEGFVAWPDEPRAPLRLAEPTVRFTQLGADVFADLLRQRGVVIDGGTTTGTHPPTSVEVATIDSAPLEAIVTTVNTFSSSLGSQMLLRHVGLDAIGTGSEADGVAAVLANLADRGLPLDGVTLVDGIGLAEQNLIPCALFLQLLLQVGPDSPLARSMSIAGTRGTAGDRFTNPELRDLVRAKTGTLRDSRALAGFARSWVDGEDTPFVFIQNQTGLSYDEFDPWARLAQEDLLVALVQFPCVPDRAALDALLPTPSAMPDPDVELAQGDQVQQLDDRLGSRAVDPGAPPTEAAAGPDPDLLDRLATAPADAGCDDGQRVNDLDTAGYLVELRYSPACDTLWARATFSAVGSGAARLHLMGYTCPEAETGCRSVARSIRLASPQLCADDVDESGTCRLGSVDQIWTEMLPGELANVRACLSLAPSFAGDDPAALDLDACTQPAFELLPSADGPVRTLARPRTACRQPLASPPVELATASSDPSVQAADDTPDDAG